MATLQDIDMDHSPPSAGTTTIRTGSDGKPRWRRLAHWAVYLILAVAAVWVLQSGIREIQTYEWQHDLPALALAFGFWMLTTIGAACCWLVVMRTFGIRLPVGHTLKVFCTSNLGKYLPGKVLHVAARLYLVQEAGVAIRTGTSSILLDVLLYIGAGMTFAALALPAALPTLISRFGLPVQLGAYWPVVMSIAAIAFLAGLVVLHPRVLNGMLRVVGRKVSRFRGVRMDLAYGTVLRIFSLYLLLWVAMAAAVYTTVRVVYPVEITAAPLLGAVFALAYIVGLVLPTPAGVGPREGIFIALLGAVGVDFAPALVASILARLLQVGAEATCAGALSLLFRD
ncbi:MAG: flippase-like domain-containing protein [Chloroflexi bacterium]|nr:flippase-like domain-containing protein [Chloroflexota bacterium]